MKGGIINSMKQAAYDCDWEKFVEVPSLAVLAIVKKFYVNMINARQNKCFVRGWVKGCLLMRRPSMLTILVLTFPKINVHCTIIRMILMWMS